MRFFLILIFVFSFVRGISQNLRIINFEEVSNDITASTNVRYDSNGLPCALLKVQFPEHGLIFNGNIVGETRYDRGEYNVFMTEGSKEIEIKHNSYYPLKISFKDFQINKFSSKRTYRLRLESSKKQQVLNVSYTPHNAMVIIDDENIEAANGETQILLPIGEHRYNIVANGYYTQTGSITVRDDVPAKLIIALDKKGNPINGNNSSSINNEQTNTFKVHEITEWNYIYGSQPLRYVLIIDNFKKLNDAKSKFNKLAKQEGCIINALNTYFAITYSCNDINIIEKEWRSVIANVPDAWVAELKNLNNSDTKVSKKIEHILVDDNQRPLVHKESSQHIYEAEEVDLSTRLVKDWSLEEGILLHRYGIIPGSFGLKKNAQKFLKKIGNNGTIIYDKQTGIYRVITYSSDDALEIKNKLEEFRESYPGAWVALFKNTEIQ